MVKYSDSVIKGHGLDVEGREDGLLVCQGGVVVGGHLRGEDDAHITEVHVDSAQVGTAEGGTLKHEGERCDHIR